MRTLTGFLISCLLLGTEALAEEWRLLAEGGNLRVLDVEKVDLEYSKLNPANRDPYAPDLTGKWRERVALKFDLNLARYNGYGLFWDNNVHTETIDSGAVKTVGWEWELGMSLGKYADIFHHHHSKHIMDEKPQRDAYNGKSNQFPVEDSLVIRVHLMRGK